MGGNPLYGKTHVIRKESKRSAEVRVRGEKPERRWTQIHNSEWMCMEQWYQCLVIWRLLYKSLPQPFDLATVSVLWLSNCLCSLRNLNVSGYFWLKASHCTRLFKSNSQMAYLTEHAEASTYYLFFFPLFCRWQCCPMGHSKLLSSSIIYL